MRKTLTAALCALSLFCGAQEDLQAKAAAVQEEGRKLYRLEMASWYGTDIFLERFGDLKTKSSGYFSYNDGPLSRCVFYSKDPTPKALVTVSFDSTYNVQTATVDGNPRDLTAAEREVYGLRRAAAAIMGSDTLFKSYQNTSFNAVPLVDGGERKVYVLTGTTQHGTVMFGNDYLMTFDAANNLLGKRKLHKGLIPIKYGGEGKEKAETAMHSHLPEMGELMTATDVCTLMLYRHLTQWKQHLVVSKNYVSLWDADKDHLLVLTMDAWKKITKD